MKKYTEEEQLSELEVSEEIMILLSQLPIKEMDELGNEDPQEAVRRTLECYGIDELIDLRDELQKKVDDIKPAKKRRLLKVESKIFKAMLNVAQGRVSQDILHKTAKHIANYVIKQ